MDKLMIDEDAGNLVIHNEESLPILSYAPNGGWCGITALDRQTLVDWLENALREMRQFSHLDADQSFGPETPFLRIDLECGCEVRFTSVEELPHDDLKCEHGNTFIRYGQ